MRVREFMQSPVQACAPEATLPTAARQMAAHNVGSLVVTDDAGGVVGIVTDRDLALSIGGPEAATVGDLMTRTVTTIDDDADMHDAAALMDSQQVRRLPVVDEGGRCVGTLCLDDVFGYLAQEALTLSGAVKSQGVVRP